MNQNLPQDLDRESLNQLSKEELVEIIIEQSKVIRELQKIIYELQQELERLKVSRDLDSKTSSKPPSGDILKKSENKKAPPQEESNHPKRKPGGQVGHKGKTRKGFGKVDRYEILRPSDCVCCGKKAFASVAVKVEKHSVAQLIERPIEIVEYQRHTCVCECCGNVQTASWSPDIVPGQDLGVRLQAFLGWVNNYAHMPYEKQQEMLWELGQIDIGLGTLVATNEQIQQAIEPSINELSNWVKQTQPNIHVDEHLVRAIRKSDAKNIAISIRSNNSPDTIKLKKADLYKKLCDGQNERPNLFFFDAQTHPLGSLNIRIQDN